MALLLLAAGVFLVAQPGRKEAGRHSTGLFTSLPILWHEAGSVSDLLRQETSPHWARAVLQKHGPVHPLDTLAPISDRLPLVVLAQPRPLSPQENVALDAWVREGGRILLFADPMLTFDSSFAIGDRRRPEDVVLLSPILARWGLQLQFDEAQPAGKRMVPLLGGELPVNLPGRFVQAAGSRGCAIIAGGIAAQCRVGKGRVLAVADAALLEPAAAKDAGRRSEMLERLLAAIENAG